MSLSAQDLILVTGATGLVGSHLVVTLRQQGLRVRALVRDPAAAMLVAAAGAELAVGDLSRPESLAAAVRGATIIVHCAAKVGDWGPVDEYRQINVRGLEQLLLAAEQQGTLRRFIHISSLGVYPARDHYGTDETTPPSSTGIDGYTLTKVESEQLVLQHVREHGLPAVVLRPGFIYGPRDRSVLPRVIGRLRDGKFAYLGSPDLLMNNTYVGNLIQAILLALDSERGIGQVYNITDGRLVSKREFVETICRLSNLPAPKKVVPLGIARPVARVLETVWKWLGKTEAPLLSQARIKFLGLNLDYSIGKSKRELGYAPSTDFQEAIAATLHSDNSVARAA